jgi:hypothetical protein
MYPSETGSGHVNDTPISKLRQNNTLTIMCRYSRGETIQSGDRLFGGCSFN